MSMQDTINGAMVGTMGQMASDPVIKESIGGNVGTFIRSAAAGLFIATSAIGSAQPITDNLVATPRVESQSHSSKAGILSFGGIAGGVAGGLIGNQVMQGNGKTAATALGAVIGSQVGSAIEGPSAPQYQQPQYRQPQYQQPQYQQPQYQQQVPNEGDGVIGGALIGGAAGGILGNQVGKRNGKIAATALGAVLGTFVGAGTAMAINRRDAQYAQYAQGRTYGPANGPQYSPPVNQTGYAEGPHPMTNYAPNFLGQLQGSVQPAQPLSPEARLALEKGMTMLSEVYREAADSQNVYAGAYDKAMKSRQAQNSPYYNMSGSESTEMVQQRMMADRNLGQIAQQRILAERKYVAGLMRVLDAGEYAASRGENTTEFANLLPLMSLPTVDNYRFTSPITHQTMTVQTVNRPR